MTHAHTPNAGRYIAYTFETTGRQRALYVSDLPEGCGDYGFVLESAHALPLTDLQWKRFARRCSELNNCVAFCVPTTLGGGE